MQTQSLSRGNRLFNALPSAAYAEIERRLQPVRLSLGDVVFDVGHHLQSLFFPVSAVVSAVLVVSGKEAEVAIIGSEGFLGVQAWLGRSHSRMRSIVQHPGEAYTLPIDVIRPMPAVQKVLNSYAAVFISMVAQSAACRSVHSATQQVARWLLMTHDRVGGPSFHVTHEALARMLAVRRATITKVALSLQSSGAIDYDLGHVRIMDRDRLERIACECYKSLRALVEEELPAAAPERLPAGTSQ